MASPLTPEQIAIYAATLRARTAEEARRRERRRQPAGALAREAAAILRERFGATGVRVFGSLLDANHFTEHSDIDLAAAGLDPLTHLEALGLLLGLSPDFESDLVDLEHCPAALRRVVEETGVVL